MSQLWFRLDRWCSLVSSNLYYLVRADAKPSLFDLIVCSWSVTASAAYGKLDSSVSSGTVGIAIFMGNNSSLGAAYAGRSIAGLGIGQTAVFAPVYLAKIVSD